MAGADFIRSEKYINSFFSSEIEERVELIVLLTDDSFSGFITKQLLKIIVHKQAMVRALCKRLVELEGGKNVNRVYFKG